MRVFGLGALALLGASPLAAQSPPCTTRQTRIAPDSVSGAFIRAVSVETVAPIALPSAGSWLTGLRRRTETSVVARQLLFARGDRLDSARVAETLRRLRDQRLYADILLTVTRCADGDTVDLHLVTRDAWTLRPIARIVPPATVSLGVEDRNILGTARTLLVSNDQTANGHGGTAAVVDPWLFGTNVIGAARISDVAGTHLLRSSLRTHEHSTFDRFRMDAAIGRQKFSDSIADERPIRSGYEVAHAGLVVDSTRFTAVSVYAGGEHEDGEFISILPGDDGIPHLHRRDFIGLDAGVQLRTVRFETANWFTDGRGLLDVPTGLQADLLTSVGADPADHEPALRYDGWIGKMWTPSYGQLFTVDAWANGYLGPVRPNHVDRVSASGFLAAPRGFWGGRVMLEQLIQLDPDLRMLALARAGADPSFAAVPSEMRSANRALVANVERSVHIRPVARASMVDAALFAAGSLRWDSPARPAEHFRVGVVGGRLRLFSANGTFSSMRVDVAVPVAANASVVHRPLLSIGLTSLIDAPHLRDDRRRQQ
jgi:hypothetical protein